jgi:phosphomevalonate kinase
MSPQPSSVTALSAPGKVLLTGGYLVLDRAYTGTVFALDARIHVVVQQLRRGHRRGPSGTNAEAQAAVSEADTEAAKHEGEEQEAEHTVVVRSPQFVDAVWEYGVQRCENGGGVKVIQKGNGYGFPQSVIGSYEPPLTHVFCL